jgi:hypothetical protein
VALKVTEDTLLLQDPPFVNGEANATVCLVDFAIAVSGYTLFRAREHTCENKQTNQGFDYGAIQKVSPKSRVAFQASETQYESKGSPKHSLEKQLGRNNIPPVQDPTLGLAKS